jgi:hypothetical protein
MSSQALSGQVAEIMGFIPGTAVANMGCGDHNHAQSTDPGHDSHAWPQWLH